VHRRSFAAFGALALLVVTTPARAQDEGDGALPPPLDPAAPAPALARPPAAPAAADPDKLFAEAMNLIAQEKFDEAIPKLEEAQRIDPGIGTQFNLAICYAKTGRLALAWKNFRQVEILAGAAGRKERAEAARGKLAELRPQLASISVRLVRTAGIIVSVDGEIVPTTEVGFIPVDPGEHKVEVSAPGKEPFLEDIAIAGVAGERREVVVRPLAPLGMRTEIRTVTEETTNTTRTLGYVFGSVGIAGLAAATVTGILILSDKSTASERCKPDCVTATGEVDTTGADAVQRGNTLLPVNIVAWVVAGAGLGAGAVFLIISRKQPPKAAQTTVVPSFDARGGGSAVLTTTF
jgi:hypothetical protein